MLTEAQKMRQLLNEMENVEPIELTSILDDREAISQAWANGLTYDGHDIFELYIEQLDSIKAAGRLPDDNQESYLGYIPSQNLFVSGFDIWPHEDEGPRNMIVFSIDNGRFRHKKTLMMGGRNEHGSVMIYGRNGGLEELKSIHPDLVDIRLD